MAEPVPKTWADTETIAEADLNGISDGLRFLLGITANSKPVGEATSSTPQEISSPSVYTLVDLGTPTVDKGGPSVSGGTFIAGTAGKLRWTATVRISASLGNKEVRLIVDGVEEDYFAADNRFGIATTAFTSMNIGGAKFLTAGQSVDLAVFCDAPTPPSVIYFFIEWTWEASAT